MSLSNALVIKNGTIGFISSPLIKVHIPGCVVDVEDWWCEHGYIIPMNGSPICYRESLFPVKPESFEDSYKSYRKEFDRALIDDCRIDVLITKDLQLILSAKPFQTITALPLKEKTEVRYSQDKDLSAGFHMLYDKFDDPVEIISAAASSLEYDFVYRPSVSTVTLDYLREGMIKHNVKDFDYSKIL